MWDLKAALDPRAPASTLCLRTLVVRHYLYTASQNNLHNISVNDPVAAGARGHAPQVALSGGGISRQQKMELNFSVSTPGPTVDIV